MTATREDVTRTSSPKCPTCDRDQFELRVLRDEAVATARCLACSANYLLLDSQDYWFDVIQKGYPRVTRCACKSQSFRLRIDYSVRDDGDVDYIEVHSICSACGKTRRRLDFEVDYGGTEHLLTEPLVRCKNPKILYDLKDISLLITLPDMIRIVDHLAADGSGEFLSRVREDDVWTLIRQDAAEAKETIEKRKYLFVYALPTAIAVSEDEVKTIPMEDSFWKRSEVIRIGSKCHVCEYQFEGRSYVSHCGSPPTRAGETELGLSFELNFSNEYVRGEQIVSKSEAFRRVTGSLLSMLQNEFVSWRAPSCFDNPDVNVRVFGDRFRTRAR